MIDYIDEQDALTDEYRGSVLLHNFNINKMVKLFKEDRSYKWTDDDIMTYIISSNPVLWAQLWLKNPKNPREPLKLFHYQKSMLNCQHRFKVTRCGRQVGKTLCMAIEIIWSAMTTEYDKILYVAPYQAQVKVLYEDTMMRLIADVPDIHKAIVKQPSHPYYKAEFSNGSQISAMTAGSRSGQKGSSIRGQSNVHRLYLDEVEYMGSEAINSIVPTIFANDEGRIWASSTPTGKREDFYKWCMDHDSQWICPECKAAGIDGTPFHYPSHISPLYSEVIDKFNRKSLTASMYEHEVEANWGEEVEGVFRHSDIDACLDLGRTMTRMKKGVEVEDIPVSYEMGKLVPNKMNAYILGVDWNKESTGVQLIVMEYNPNNVVINSLPPKYFRLFATESVTAKEFTERGAVARILDLCTSIPISHVYADEGYGSIQIQAIRKLLSRSNSPYLAKQIVAINMSSSQEVVDPVTKQKLLKPMKPFMVDNASRIVEDRRIILPDSEDSKTLLVGQMREYTIIRRSQTGHPIYSPDNEDVLTAFMIALLGFTCEYNEVVKVDYTQKVKRAQNPVVARAVGNIAPRVFDDSNIGKPPIPPDRQRPKVFEELARNSGIEYTYQEGDDDKPTVNHGIRSIPGGGSTGRGGSLGISNRSRFASRPARSQF